MSDDEDDSAGSSSSPEPETLVAGRAKRANAGNRLSHLLQHLDDEDVKADLLAEEEDDQKDYSASEDGDGDVAMDSSDSSDDEGKDAAGTEDLAGEKELRKQERVESKRKRKARELVRIQPLKKRVKIAEVEPVKSTAASPASTTARRPERPALADLAPVRQSSRTQTVANAKLTEAKVKANRKRSEKTHEAMRLAAERKAAEAGTRLTQADRMARALALEKENARSLNRWTKSEQERQQAQRDKLEAMRNRTIEGPFLRYWSGPITWTWRQGPEGPVYPRFKYDRDKAIEELKEAEEAKHAGASRTSLDTAGNEDVDMPDATTSTPKQSEDQEKGLPASAIPAITTTKDADESVTTTTTATPAIRESPQPLLATSTIVPSEASLLDGIETYVTEDGGNLAAHANKSDSGIATTDEPAVASEARPTFLPLPSMPPYHHIPTYPTSSTNSAASLPLHSERATRCLIILEQFPSLSPPPASTSKRAGHSAADTNPISAILIPDARPPLSGEERRYLSSKSRRATIAGPNTLPAPPVRAVCAISGRPARFRDPKTRLPYADLAASKAIQRVLANGCQWSPLLGVWAGIVGEGALGRVARGVPEGFWKGVVPEKEKEAEVKAEGGREVIEIL